MRNLIIVEGPDCSGKTTFCTRLVRAINAFGGPKAVGLRTAFSKALQEGMLDYQTALFRDIKGINDNGMVVVLDRSWPSEAVYAPVFRPEAKGPLTQVKIMAEQCAPAYIFLDREDVELAHAENKDKAHPYNKRQFARVVKGYKKLAAEMQEDWFLGPRTFVEKFDDYKQPIFIENQVARWIG